MRKRKPDPDEERRKALSEMIRLAIEAIDFAEWEGEMDACCDGGCHVVHLLPDGAFRIWCDCVSAWIAQS